MYTKFKAAFTAASSLKCFWIVGAVIHIIRVFPIISFKISDTAARKDAMHALYTFYKTLTSKLWISNNGYGSIYIPVLESAGQGNETGKLGLNIIPKIQMQFV